MKLKEIILAPSYTGGGVNVDGYTEEGKRVFIVGADKIILNALNEKGFKLSKTKRQKYSRCDIKSHE